MVNYILDSLYFPNILDIFTKLFLILEFLDLTAFFILELIWNFKVIFGDI